MTARRTTVPAVGLLVVAFAAACSGHTSRRPAAIGPTTTSTTAAPAPTAGPPTTTKPVQVKAAGLALTPFSSCPELLKTVRAEAASEVTGWGLPSASVGGGYVMPSARMTNAAPAMAAGPGMAADSAAAPAPEAASTAGGAAAGSSAGPAFSTTNNQEAGVDEPDLAKTDGHLMVVLRNHDVIQVVQVDGAGPANRGAVMLPSATATGLFLVGKDVVVLGSSMTYAPPPSGPPTPAQGGAAAGGNAAVAPEPPGGRAIAQPMPAMAPYPPYQSNNTIAWVISLADPDHPTISRSFTVSGSEVDARLIGHSVKLVVESQPQMVFPQPQDSSNAGLAKAVAANRAIIAKAPLSAWVPTIADGAGTRPADCGSVDHAPTRYGVGMVSVVTFDPDQSKALGMVSVLGNPGTVYASTTNLYVATNSYDTQQAMATGAPVSSGVHTDIHDFSIADPSGASYVGSGAVPGVLLNQFSMSEYNGNLRVATTTGTPSPPPFEGGPVPPADGSQSLVTVLHAGHGKLMAIGQVGGLGLTQKIYGVRFVGPLGYVVTFRQMDPLYVIDLSVPTLPVVRGALELTGYSAYLHSVADGLLLGVGEASDASGRPEGMQVSLFNVHNPGLPSLVSKDVEANANAAVVNDSHAFLWWPATRLAVLPATQWGDQSSWAGAFAFHIDGTTGLTKVGQITHTGRSGTGSPGIERAIAVGNRLYTVSDAGVLASDIHTLGDVGWVAFTQ